MAARTPGTAANRATSPELTRAAFPEHHVVVFADKLLPGHHRRCGSIAFNGGMGSQRRLEGHAPRHHQD